MFYRLSIAMLRSSYGLSLPHIQRLIYPLGAPTPPPQDLYRMQIYEPLLPHFSVVLALIRGTQLLERKYSAT